MNATQPLERGYVLLLSDGSRFFLTAADPDAWRIVDFWAEKSRLNPSSASSRPAGCRRLSAVTGGLDELPDRMVPVLRLPDRFSTGPDDLVCLLEPPGMPKRLRRIETAKSRLSGRPLTPEFYSGDEWFWRQLARLSATIGRSVQGNGGALIHSGLAEYVPGGGTDRFGFLLAGRSGVGKSTAGRRLPPPWISLSDDMTLVAKSSPAGFLAHPFPTWSRFFGIEAGDGSDTWDVQKSVPLRAVFVLEQGREDRAEPLGRGHALSLLVELSQQASLRLTPLLTQEELMAFNLQRFENISGLVKTLPAYLLHVRLDGAFWNEIGRILRKNAAV